MNQAERKKILYCESNIDGTIGGSFYSLFFLVEGLDKTKFEPTVIFYQEHSLIPMFKEAGIKVEVFQPPKPYHININLGPLNKLVKIIQSGINFYRFFIRQAYRFKRYIKENNIELVHLNNTILRNHNWMLAAKLSGIKCVSHERGINPAFPFLARYFAKRIDAIVCISNAVETNFKDKGINFGNLVQIYNGIDPEKVIVKKPLNEIRQQHDVQMSDVVVGVVGNIRGWKGQETIIKSVNLIKDSFPNIKCLIVGDTSSDSVDYLEHLKNLIKEYGIESNIIFTGYQSNVADYMNAMDIVVHTSVLPEPFGRVLIEAMALSKPLIGSKAGAVPEIIDDGVTGLMFTPGDEQDLAKKLQTMLGDMDKAKKMGEKGSERLAKEFHIKHNIRKTQELYHSLFGSN